MAGVVSQNDLIDIIKAQVESLTDIMDVVFSAISKEHLYMDPNFEKDLKSFIKKLNIVIGPKGIISILMIYNEKLSKIKPIKKKSIKIIKKSIYGICDLLKDINEEIKSLGGVDLASSSLSANIKSTIELISLIIEIQKLKTRGVNRKIKALCKIIKSLGSLLRIINHIRGDKRALINITLLQQVVKGIGGLIGYILLIVPLIILLVMFSPIILICFAALVLILKFITFVLSKAVSRKTLIILAVINTILILLTITATLLLLMAIIVTPLIENILNILLFFGVILALAVLLGTIGWVLTKASKFLFYAIYGIAIIAILVGLVFLMAIMLKSLETLKLDKEKILENVKTVFECAFAVIEALFADVQEPGEKSNVFTKILNVLGGAVVKIIMAMSAAVILVATFVSVLMILLIASVLRLLQEIDLDPAKIQENVALVFETSHMVINELWDRSDDKNNESNRNLLSTILDYMGMDQLAMILDAILSIAFLALTVVSVTLILVLAGMLKLLQELNLDPPKIQESVETIFNTTHMVINALWDRSDDKSNDSGRTTLGKLLAFLGMNDLADIVDMLLAIAFLALSVMTIGLITVLALDLALLQSINLNPSKIQKNVETVCNTASLVISALWGRKDDKNNPSNRSSLGKLLAFLGMDDLADIIDMLMAIAFLALSVMAIGLVTVLALDLALLQTINLKPNKIKENVETVCDTATLVIDQLWGRKDNKSGRSERGGLFKLLKFLGMDDMASIIDMLMAVAFLALSVMAIGLVTTLALQLSCLQKLDLNPPKIKENVVIVCDTAMTVIDTLWDRPDDKNNESKRDKGLFGNVLSFFGMDQMLSIIDMLMAVAFLALALLAIQLIVGLANELKKLGEMTLDRETIIQNVILCIDCAQIVTNELWDRPDDKNNPSKKQGIIDVILNFFAPELVQILNALMAIAFLALTLAAIKLIVKLASELMKINAINFDEAGIKKKLRTVMSCSKLVIDEVNRKDTSKQKQGKGFLRKLLEMVLPDSLLQMIDAIMAIGFLAMALTAVGLVGQIAKHLSTIAKLPSMDGIERKTKQVIGTARSVISYVMSKGGTFDEDSYVADVEGILHNLIKSMKTIYDLALNLCNFNKITWNRHLGPAKERGQQIINSAVSLLNTINNSKYDHNKALNRLKLFNYMYTIIKQSTSFSEKDAKNSEKITNNYVRFLDKINTVDLEHLKTAERLFQNLAKFSETINGNFDKLADSLNEKVAPLLEELKERLDQINGVIDQSAKDIQQTTLETSGTGATGASEETIQRVAGDDEEKRNIFDQVREKARQDSKKQYNSMQDIMDILLGQGGYRGVKIKY